MAGPNSLPSGDKARYADLQTWVCVVHKNCGLDLRYCNVMTLRESLWRRGRLTTGKTK